MSRRTWPNGLESRSRPLRPGRFEGGRRGKRPVTWRECSGRRAGGRARPRFSARCGIVDRGLRLGAGGLGSLARGPASVDLLARPGAGPGDSCDEPFRYEGRRVFQRPPDSSPARPSSPATPCAQNCGRRRGPPLAPPWACLMIVRCCWYSAAARRAQHQPGVDRRAAGVTAALDVVHISGTLDWPSVQEWAQGTNLGPALQKRYHAYPYLHDAMTDALRAADWSWPAGASTLGEFPSAGAAPAS